MDNKLVITCEGGYVKVISEEKKSFAYADRVWLEEYSLTPKKHYNGC